MHPELEHLARADGLDREIRATDAALREAEAALAGAREQVALQEKTVSSLVTERDAQTAEERRLERELHRYRDRRTSALRVLEGGGGDPEAASRQVEQCEQILDRTETDLLQLLEEVDALCERLARARAALEEATHELAQREESHPTRMAELQSRRLELVRARDEELEQVDPATRSRYETLRARKGTAVARIEGGACSACRQVVQQQHIADLNRGLMEPCRGCGRWLLPPQR